MKHDEENREFQNILAALNERELTDWERERLWELLESDPTRIDPYTEHCFLAAEIAALSDADLSDVGIPRKPRNVVPITTTNKHPSRRVHQWVIGVAASITLLILAFSNFKERAPDPVALSQEKTSQEIPSPTMRNANLSLDDPADEAVALSGAGALANSRNPRGGTPEGSSKIPELISFNHHVRPILSENCFFCHGPDEKTQEADLRLDQAEGATADLGGYAAIVPGDAESSEVWQRIISDDPDDVMPPLDSHRELNETDREILRLWIDGGAEYDPHWAYIPPLRSEVPDTKSEEWVKNPIDAFILNRLTREGFTANPPAEPRALLRRLSLDLIGLPVSPEESVAFEESFATNPDLAIEVAFERLIQSPHHGEMMALPWLDVARYGDSNGFQQDGNRHQWPWRDWVINAYNANMPFDQFTIEQLAGDLLPDPTNDQIVATAFNRNHMLNGEGGAIKEEQRINYVIDRVDTTATTWLGLTMACAQCHTHKYDPITHEEFYSFFAFFNNIPESGGVDQRSAAGCSFGTGSTVQVSRPWLSLAEEDQLAEQKQLNESLSRLKMEIKEQIEVIDLRRREWEAQFTAIDLTDRTRFGNASTVLRTPEKDRKASQNDTVTEFFLLKGEHDNKKWLDLGKEIRTVRLDLKKVSESIINVMVMEENPIDKTRETFVLSRGDYQNPLGKVTPGTPAFLPAMAEDLPPNRLGLARWLVDAQHPLTARVAVNRLWQQFFGVGLVKTSEDFGVQGELPAHPELLDWLAVEFVESGWDQRHLIHLIITSSTYQQSSDFNPEKHEQDPENRLLARGARARLPAMLLRDQALAISGLLIPDVGGLPVYPHQPDGLWSEFSFGKISYPHQEAPEQLHRRSLYSFWRRTSSPPNMFDSSVRQVCTVKPSITNTPLHALTLLNDITYVETARALASRMMNEGGAEAESRLEFAFELATGRHPDEQELQLLLNGFERSRNEFGSFEKDALTYAATDNDVDSVEIAAYTRMAQVILNLDETLNRP